TVDVLADGVYHIEDANDSNPAGMHMDENGQVTGMNNCSDMYLVVGEDKALLIDLSNAIQWDNTATESLRSIVYDRVGDKEFLITVTHNHGDHLGMLPAFAQDPGAAFLLSENEFKGVTRFPEERTTYFAENAAIDLGGGYVISTMEVPGHTQHSTLFFLKEKHLVFTGDAIGSGSGVWLFNYDAFLSFIKGMENLIRYLEDPVNRINLEQLVIHGGHSWQRGNLEKLTVQYVYDMQTLIDRIGQGIAETEDVSLSFPFLNANFKYGTATITWNKEAAAQYADSVRASSGTL
ncbi:MAG: MBL fold metallo-hydrolase, partial [Bacteroidales bacterium]|nr:MBL fold metallo-hydrolase [Bacteroidales bacterium]